MLINRFLIVLVQCLLGSSLIVVSTSVSAADTDKDGFDDGVDNCVLVVNPGQVDSDVDGLGNLCDADFNNDGNVNLGDLFDFKQNFGGSDPVFDLDGSGGLVNLGDLIRFKQLFQALTPTVQWPAVNSVVTEDVEARVAGILSSMTLAEKVGQMVMAEISAVNIAAVTNYDLGGILNGGGSWPNGNKYSSVADWVSLADSYYNASTDTSDGGVGVPVIWGTDAVHGHNNVIGATIFPHNIGLGAANNPALMRQIGEVTALEVAVTGIDWVFAPTLAVVRNDRWGRTYEGYSEDPAIVQQYAGEMVSGMQGLPGEGNLFDDSRVVATAKHWLGDGGTQNGTDQGNTAISEIQLRNLHAQGYFTALGAGAQTVMASYNSWEGFKLHGSEYLLTDVLKQEMGFDGFVIGDWNGHGQVPGCSDDQCAQAIIAGVDMIMVPYAWQNFINNTISQVNSGTIPLARIDDAVTRILRVKARSGLLDKPAPSLRTHANNTSILASVAHRNLARQAVRESLVLLKNSNSLLPLDPSLNVLVAGDGADNIPKQCGGWTITWQGTGNTNSDFPQASSILDGIQGAVNASGGSVSYSVNGSFNPASPPDVAIVVYGESPYAEGAGDLFNIEYQAGSKTDLATLQSLKSQGIPVVSVFLSGRPLWMNKELNASDAFVAAWLPGSEGGGIADVIFSTAAGDVNFDFTGKLSFSWPKTGSQHELNRYDSNYDPLFAYGYGLTYQDIDTLGDDLDETGGGNLETVISVPGIVEAELFSNIFGLQTETSTDSGGGTGGGLNLGYADPGDWVEYELDIATAGDYQIEYRVASWGGSAGFLVLLDGVQIDAQGVANTGGWQNWITQTSASTVTLPAGRHTLRLNSVGNAWNLNWMRFNLM